jgi:hypothetical protein
MKDLPTYLNDHLAGSTAALDMLDDMIGTHRGKPLASFLKRLRDEIEADQRELKELMARLDIEESPMRKAGAWVAEKFSRAKLRLGDAGEANLALLQSFETLSLGITGKRSLWRTLAAAAESAPRLSGLDFTRLEKRAADQFEQVQGKALEIARRIFSRDLNERAD